MEPCRIVGAICFPINTKTNTKRKSYKGPLTFKLGPLVFKAYAEKSRKNNNSK